MSHFTAAELDYIGNGGGRRLARIATVGADGTPHVVPVGLAHNGAADTIDVRGRDLEGTKKFRDVARSGRAAIVADTSPAPTPGARAESRCAAAPRRSPSPRR